MLKRWILPALLLSSGLLSAGIEDIEKAVYFVQNYAQLNAIPEYIDPYQLCGSGKRTTVTADHLFTYNNLEQATQYNVGDLIPFNAGLDVVGGTAITHPTHEQFVITKKGRYLVTFMGATNNNGADSVAELTADEFTGQTLFFLNGSPIGASLEINILGGMVVNQVIIPVSAVPATLNLRVTNDSLLLNIENSATLAIVRLSAQT